MVSLTCIAAEMQWEGKNPLMFEVVIPVHKFSISWEIYKSFNTVMKLPRKTDQ